MKKIAMMKIVLLVFLCFMLFQTVAEASVYLTFEIEAYIDGRDILIIQDNTLQWQHLEYAAVGRWAGQNEPTKITTYRNGIKIDNFEWTPQWAEGPPAEIRDEAFSNVLIDLETFLPSTDMTVTLTPIQSRGQVTVQQLPMLSNDYTLMIDFNDTTPSGADWYSITVDIVPEPATLSLLALGGLVLRRRRKA